VRQQIVDSRCLTQGQHVVTWHMGQEREVGQSSQNAEQLGRITCWLPWDGGGRGVSTGPQLLPHLLRLRCGHALSVLEVAGEALCRRPQAVAL
jgi:hypothetical protein